jgi:coenzyme F420-reducing hydrogenase beta subunit
MHTLAKKEDCCGGAACYNACNNNAIKMIANEAGFLYPEIDSRVCKECDLCTKVCPAIRDEPSSKSIDVEKAYVVRNKELAIVKQSTSGGAFSAIASLVIRLGGVVFGAAMDTDFKVYHRYVDSIEDIGRFRNSKYVQSKIGNCYKECKEFLSVGRYVCFSGTPCQIAGLHSFLGREYEKLITVDIVCHSVPSPAVFEKYMELQKQKYPSTQKVVFRDKEWGYSYSTMALYDKDSRCLYRRGSESDLWFRSFLPGLCDRENCYHCAYQQYPRESDITIWDCFNVRELAPEFDDNLGATSVMTWSSKGMRCIEQNNELIVHEVPSNTFTNKIEREKDVKINLDRKQLYSDLREMTPRDFFVKYRKEGALITLKRILRVAMLKVGIYDAAKKIIR